MAGACVPSGGFAPCSPSDQKRLLSSFLGLPVVVAALEMVSGDGVRGSFNVSIALKRIIARMNVRWPMPGRTFDALAHDSVWLWRCEKERTGAYRHSLACAHACVRTCVPSRWQATRVMSDDGRLARARTPPIPVNFSSPTLFAAFIGFCPLSYRSAAMSFIANADLCCPICDVVYPTANSVFSLTCADEGLRSHILRWEFPQCFHCFVSV